jgi:class 3 adenylate cyclase/tetratricopeptide (TPR) repeat protein
MLFCDVSDSTRIAGGMEAEDYAELLGELRQVCEQVVARHGGEIVRIDGDGVAVIFGYPEAHEDDGRRAVETAIDLHEAARRLTRPFPGLDAGIHLHSGIHAGLVLVDVGDIVRGRFEMLGDATNVASRLSDLAGAGEILVSETTLGSERHFFFTGEPRVVTLRGKDNPIAVLSILGRQPLENRFSARRRRGLASFVGREAELARLQHCLRRSLAGETLLAALVGGEGLGKTRLANEFLAHAAADGMRVHRAYCEAYLGARPLQPFLQLLRSILDADAAPPGQGAAAPRGRAVEHIDPQLLDRLAELQRPAPPHADAGAGGSRPDRSVIDYTLVFRDLFERLAATGPVVVFIDDWQWADDASRRVLDAVSAISAGGMLILLATREIDVLDAGASGVEVIPLPSLSRQESETTIDAMLAAPEPFIVSRIAEYSGGNPLFIEELCHAMPHGIADTRLDTGAWLKLMIEARFARLPEHQADLVAAASVIGHMIPAWLFREITGVDEDHPIVSELARRDFIYRDAEPGMLRFKHGVTRDAIYAIVGLRERRALHLRVVEALRRRALAESESEYLEALAYHAGAGGDQIHAALFAERAGDKAMSASALDRAQAQYRAALAALDALPATDGADRWDSVARKFAQASIFDPMRDQLPILRRLRERAAARRAPDALALADYWLGVLNYGLGECRQAIGHCQRALAAVPVEATDKLTVEIRATLGRAHAIACEYGQALRLLEPAIEAKKRHRRPYVDAGLVYTISSRAFLLADQGRFEEASAGFDEAIGALDGAVHQVAASILTQRSGACLWRGKMDEAVRCAAEAERVAGLVKARYLFSMARALGAYARWRQDRSAEALGILVEATEWLEASESQQRISLNHGWLAEAMVETGDIGAARRHARLATRRARKGDRLGEAMAYRALARAAANGAPGRPAAHYLARAMAAANARGSPHEFAKTRLCAARIGGSAQEIAAARSALRALGLDWFVRNPLPGEAATAAASA